MRTSTAFAVIILVAFLLGGLFWFTMQATPAPTPVADNPMPTGALGLNGAPGQTNTGQESVTAAVTVSTSTKLGSFLVAQNGMTLYMFSKDATNTSNCKDTCATNWPPYIVASTEPLVPGANIDGLLSTVARDDGAMQLTYNGKSCRCAHGVNLEG